MKKKELNKKNVEKIIALGKQKGYLTYDEVNNLLPEDVSSSEEIDKIFELLGNEDIQVVENIEEKTQEKQIQNLKEEALNESIAIAERFLPLDDPVKMYLKQMGSISLLSRENEIELAKKIEEAEERFKRAALAAKFIRNEILKVVNDILEEKINFDEVLKEDIKVNKGNVLRRIKKISQRLKSTRSDTRALELLLQFNINILKRIFTINVFFFIKLFSLI